jgi:hypothetical protein
MQVTKDIRVTTTGTLRQEHSLSAGGEVLGILTFQNDQGLQATFEHSGGTWALRREGTPLSVSYALYSGAEQLIGGGKSGLWTTYTSFVFHGQQGRIKQPGVLSPGYQVVLDNRVICTIKSHTKHGAVIRVKRPVDLALVVFCYFVFYVRQQAKRRKRLQR